MTKKEIKQLASEWLIKNVNNQTSEKIAFVSGFNKAKENFPKEKEILKEMKRERVLTLQSNTEKYIYESGFRDAIEWIKKKITN